MTDERIAWLRATIEDDLAAAVKATAGPWSYNPGKIWLDGEAFETFDRSKGEEFVGHGGPSPYRGCVAATGPAGHPQSMADAMHIALHDPRDVIADCEAKLAIIRLLEPQLKSLAAQHGYTKAATTIMLMAQGYQHRPGFPAEWKPAEYEPR